MCFINQNIIGISKENTNLFLSGKHLLSLLDDEYKDIKSKHVINEFNLSQICYHIRKMQIKLPIILQSKQVAKSGLMYRKKTIISPYTECFLIMTKDKYLHIFDSELDKKPALSLDLLNIEVSVRKNDDKKLEIQEIGKKSLFGILNTGKKYYY